MLLKAKPAFRLPAKAIALRAFAWPGGYPIYYYPKNEQGHLSGDVMCPACATKERFTTAFVADVYWEGPPEQCCECGAELESAYGDPDEGEDEGWEGDYDRL